MHVIDRGDVVREQRMPESRSHAGGLGGVLDRHRQPVQRSAPINRHGIGGRGPLDGAVMVQCDNRVDPWVQLVDRVEVSADEFNRTDLPRPQKFRLLGRRQSDDFEIRIHASPLLLVSRHNSG